MEKKLLKLFDGKTFPISSVDLCLANPLAQRLGEDLQIAGILVKKLEKLFTE